MPTLYKKYNVDSIIRKLSIEKMQDWGIRTSKRLNLSGDILQDRISEIYWSVGDLEISLGYTLWCLDYCKFPKGKSGDTYSEGQIPVIDIPETHFWFHIHNSRECMYRCWERIKSLLNSVCYPKSTDKKLYFNNLIDKIKMDPQFNSNPKLNELEKLGEIWKKVAGLRNKSSHKESSPLKSIKIETKNTGLYNRSGEGLNHIYYEFKSLNNEVKVITDLYKKLILSIKVVQEFIDIISRR